MIYQDIVNRYCAYKKWYLHFVADVIIGIQLVQILFHKSFFPEKWLRRLQLNQKLCHIAIDTVKMIHSS
jgi:hypothetical protein